MNKIDGYESLKPDWLIRDNMLYQEMNPDPVKKGNDSEFEKFIKELENE